MTVGLRAYVRTAAGTGLVLIALWYVVSRHYLQVTWTIGPPVPVAWVAAAEVAYLVGMPVLFVAAGLETRVVVRRPWRRMLLRWTVPLFAFYVLALLAANAVMWRFNAAFGASRARDTGELLEQLLLRPSDAWFLYALALFPVVARLGRGLPAVVLLPAAAVAAVAGTAVPAGPGNPAELLAALFFFLLGARWPETVGRAATLPAGLRRGAVAAGGAAVLACAGLAVARPAGPPDRGLIFLLSVVALPVGLAAVAGLARRARWRRPVAVAGAASVSTYLALVPVTVLADAALLARLSAAGPVVQTVAAVAEPVALAALIVLTGLCGAPVVRRILARAGPAGHAAAAREPGPARRVGAVLLLLIPAAPAATPPAPAAAEITLAFAGDVHFERRVAALLGDPDTALGEAGRVLSAADVALLNLESPITDRGVREPKRYLFRAPASAVRALTAAGVDAVSLANNHTMDYGRQGLLDTVAAARQGRLGVFGAGRDDAEAYRPWRRTVRGVRIAVFGFSQVDDLAERWTAGPGRPGMAMAFDVERAAAAVAAARATSDVVVVMPHWGIEGDPCPDDRQRAFAARMAEAGADVVVGAHSHVLQGAGYLDRTFVAYGTGNLLWYSGGLHPPYSSRSAVLVLRLRGRDVVGHTLEPAVVSGTGQPRMLSGWQADLARRSFAALRGCARLAPDAPSR